MSKKFLSLLLALVTLLAAAPAARGQAAEELTEEEGREARELSRQFLERVRETGDVGPLVSDLFASDFAERLRNERDQLPMNFVRPEAARRASDEELLRFYVAHFNFFSLTLAYWVTTIRSGEVEGEDDGAGPRIGRMFPPEVARVLRRDPFVGPLIAKQEAEEALEQSRALDPEGAEDDGPREEEVVDERFVKDLATLRSVTATATEAAEAFRLTVPYYSAIRRAQEEKEGTPRELEEVDTPYVEIYECGQFGLPFGTRVIYNTVTPARDIQFVLLMTREAGGRLKILYAFPTFAD